MTRAVLAVVVVVFGCERARDHTPAPAPARGHDARPGDAMMIDALDVRAVLDKLPAPYPPPAPVFPRHTKGDCRIEYAPRPDRDPNPMCLVKGGTFMMGEGSGAHAVTVGDFYIDQHEVTVAQAVLFLNAYGNSCPGDLDQFPPNATVRGAHSCIVPTTDAETRRMFLHGIREHDGKYEPEPGVASTPVRTFSFEGATRYCAWVGKHVPSSAQWEYAARHDPVRNRDLVYPWGDSWPLRGDNESPWGMRDAALGDHEFVFACADPDATCGSGVPCHCTIEEIGLADPADPSQHRAAARIQTMPAGDVGVRCARRR